MNIAVSKRWEEFIEEVVSEGRFGSASEVVQEGLRLVEEREEKLAWLREKIARAIAEGGSVSSTELREALRKKAEELRRQGF
jgi:antitoxin ParD1/3/4